MTTNALYEAVCIEDYAHIQLFCIFESLLFTQPRMQVHLVDLVKSFLIKFTRHPHLLSHIIEPFSIVIGYELLDVVQFLIAFDMGKDTKKIELCGIKHRWLNTIHTKLYFEITMQR